MKEKIIEIIGFGIEPERAEKMAEQIIELFKERKCSNCGIDELFTDEYCNCCGAKQ